MTRTEYRNGDEIALGSGCDSCAPAVINGTLCHEHGCPDAWRDYKTACDKCDREFYPTYRGSQVCGRH